MGTKTVLKTESFAFLDNSWKRRIVQKTVFGQFFFLEEKKKRKKRKKEKKKKKKLKSSY